MFCTGLIMSLVFTSVASGEAPELSSKDGNPSAFDQKIIVQEDISALRKTGLMSSPFRSRAASENLNHGIPRTNSAENPLALTPAIDGYLILADYSDTSCSAVEFAEVYLLNACVQDTYNKGNYRYTATTSSYDVTLYSDTACTTVIKTSVAKPYTGACTNSRKVSVSSSGSVSSTGPLAYLRFLTKYLRCIFYYVCSLYASNLVVKVLAVRYPSCSTPHSFFRHFIRLPHSLSS